MPLSITSDMASSEGASSSSAQMIPVDSSDPPLPVPTTLATHIRGPRLLRSQSRSSRGSRSSSTAGSRNSSNPRQHDIIEPARVDSVSSGSYLLRDEGSSGSDLSIGAANAQPSNAQAHVGGQWEMEHRQSHRKRRRAYSIHDEVDPEHEASTSSQPSKFDCPTDNLPEEKLEPVVPSRRARPTKRTAKRRKVWKVDPDEAEAGPSTLLSTRVQFAASDPDVEIIRLPGESITEESEVYAVESSSSPVAATIVAPPAPTVSAAEPLAEYTCPICFSPPTNATLTPCGHICCGECLFTAVGSAFQRARARVMTGYRDPVVARCPVCRAVLLGWDGRGGGVIGLKPRTIISL